MPQIAPITAPKRMSVKKVISKAKTPPRQEKITNATIVYKNPIRRPLTNPSSLDFFNAMKTPIRIDNPFITWLTGFIVLSGIFVNFKIKANNKTKISETHTATNIPFATLITKELFDIFNELFFAFNFMINSFLRFYTFFLSRVCLKRKKNAILIKVLIFQKQRNFFLINTNHNQNLQWIVF